LAHYLDVLAIHLTLLGVISPDAEIVLRGPKTTILSYGLWRNAVGASLKILEQVALLKRESYESLWGEFTPKDSTQDKRVSHDL
jgi:hypothetical protein